MTEPDETRALGRLRWGAPGPPAASVVVLSLLWSAAACGRLGYDLLPRDDDPSAGGGSGGATSGASGAGGNVGGAAGTDGAAGEGGAPGEPDGGIGAGGTTSGAGGSAGSTAGADAGGASGAGGVAGAAGAGGSTSLPLCTDGVQNGDEGGTDCGGSDCAPCACSFGAPELLGNPNYAGNALWAPSLSADASTLYVAVVVPGFNEQIVVSTRPDRGNTFGLANVVPAPVSQSVEGTPHISIDNLSLYFFSERAGSGGEARDLYVATRSDPDGTFDTAFPLATLNSSSLDHLPWVSADELTLYFTSRRSGNLDIWRTTRGSLAQAFGAPAAVTELNSGADDNGATFTQDDRTAILSSNRPNGAGGYDLYQAVRPVAGAPFSTPVPLTELNTSATEADASLSPDGQELFFVSSRNGATEIWRSLRTCP